jgi:hypothetical protein
MHCGMQTCKVTKMSEAMLLVQRAHKASEGLHGQLVSIRDLLHAYIWPGLDLSTNNAANNVQVFLLSMVQKSRGSEKRPNVSHDVVVGSIALVRDHGTFFLCDNTTPS